MVAETMETIRKVNELWEKAENPTRKGHSKRGREEVDEIGFLAVRAVPGGVPVFSGRIVLN